MANELKWERLRDELYSLDISNNVYYNPPTSIRMSYPCFRFAENNTYTIRADNVAYLNHRRWVITYITTDEEEVETVINRMLNHFMMCNNETVYKADNLIHIVFNLYF